MLIRNKDVGFEKETEDGVIQIFDISAVQESYDVSFARARGREICGRGVVAGTKGVRDMFGVKVGPVSETKVDYNGQKKSSTYFHYTHYHHLLTTIATIRLGMLRKTVVLY